MKNKGKKCVEREEVGTVGGRAIKCRTDAERFVARKAQALGDDASPCHHDRCAVYDGKLVPERVLVQKLVKIEAAKRRRAVIVRGWAGQELVLLDPRSEPRRRRWRGGVATLALFSR